MFTGRNGVDWKDTYSISETHVLLYIWIREKMFIWMMMGEAVVTNAKLLTQNYKWEELDKKST